MYKFNKTVNNSNKHIYGGDKFMNKLIITLMCIVVVIGAMITAVVIYTPKENEVPQDITTKIAEENIIDDCTEEYEEMQNEMLETDSQEEKISPNASITFKVTFEQCGHTTSNYQDIPEELVNQTKEGLQEKYKDWEVEQFSDTQIVLNKTEEGSCKEHYIVRDREGMVTIFEILEDGTEKEYESTDIATEYLTENDKINMEKGIEVNGKQNLNQLIEDFE